LSEKLENSSTVLEGEREAEQSASIFDFIYVDQQRINTFLSQFNEFGELTNIVHGKAAQRGKGDASTIKAEANAVVAKGGADYAASTTAGYSENSQKTYDPRWVNTLSFLDQIDDRGLLKRGVENAGFGDLVLIQGPLSITDYGTLEKIWSMPAFRTAAEAGTVFEPTPNRAERRKDKSQPKPKKSGNPDLDMFFELAKVLPHTIQLKIGKNPTAWGVLSQDGLVAAASDFALKFGGTIQGDWVAVGILDAEPDSVINPEVQFGLTDLDQVAPAILSHLGPIVRQLLGRPSEAYGITPLAIFREVGVRNP